MCLLGRRALSWAVFVLALIAVLISPDPLQADVEFAAPQTLSKPEEDGAGSQLVVDSQDRATAAWQATSPDGESLLIQAVRLSADGAPGPVQTLIEMPNGPKNQLWSKWCPCPQVAVDSQGQVTVAWQSFGGTDLRVQVVRLDASGIPGPVRTLSEADEDAYAHRLAVDSAGRVTVAWSLDWGSPENKLQSVRLGSDGEPESVQTLSPLDVNAGAPDLAVDREDRVTIAWHSEDGIQAVRLGSNGLPEPLQTISPAGEDAGLPKVVVDSQGRATVAWWRGEGAYEVKAIRLGADGSPGLVRTLSPEGQDTLNPQISIDPYDRVTTTWEDFGQRVLAVRLGADGTPGPVYPLSVLGEVAGHPQVAAAPDGGAVVVWTHPPILFPPPFEGCLDNGFAPESDVVKAAFIGSDGVPRIVRTVSAIGQQSQEAQVAVDSQGRPTVVWHSFDGTYFCPGSDTRVQLSRGGISVSPSRAGLSAPSSLDNTSPVREGTLRLRNWAWAHGRWVFIRGVCAGTSGTICRGKIRLVADVHPRRILIARGRYRFVGSERRTLALKLSKSGRKLLSARTRQIRVIALGRSLRSRVVRLRN